MDQPPQQPPPQQPQGVHEKIASGVKIQFGVARTTQELRQVVGRNRTGQLDPNMRVFEPKKPPSVTLWADGFVQEQKTGDRLCKICMLLLHESTNTPDNEFYKYYEKDEVPNGDGGIAARYTEFRIEQGKLWTKATWTNPKNPGATALVGHLARLHGIVNVADAERIYGFTPLSGLTANHDHILREAIADFFAKNAISLQILESPEFIHLARALRAAGPLEKGDRGSPFGTTSTRKTLTKVIRQTGSDRLKKVLALMSGNFVGIASDIGTVGGRYIVATVDIHEPDTDLVAPRNALQHLRALPSNTSKTYLLDVTSVNQFPFTKNGSKSVLLGGNNAQEQEATDEDEIVPQKNEVPLQFVADDDDESPNDDDQQQPMDEQHQQPPVATEGTFEARNCAEWFKLLHEIITQKNGTLLNSKTDNGSNLVKMAEILATDHDITINDFNCYCHVCNLLVNDLYRGNASGGKRGTFYVSVFNSAMVIYNELRKVYDLPATVLTRWNYDHDCIVKLRRLIADGTIPTNAESEFARIVSRFKLTHVDNVQHSNAVDGALAVLELFDRVFKVLKDFTDMNQHDQARLGLQGIASLSMLYDKMSTIPSAVATRNRISEAIRFRLFTSPKGRFFSSPLALICLLFPWTAVEEPNTAVAQPNTAVPQNEKATIDSRLKAAKTILQSMNSFGIDTQDDNSPIIKQLRTRIEGIVKYAPTKNAPTVKDLQDWWTHNWNTKLDELSYFMICILRFGVSEASVERIFSIFGWTVPKRRQSLLPANAGAILHMQKSEPFATTPVDMARLGANSISINLVNAVVKYATERADEWQLEADDRRRQRDDVIIFEKCFYCAKQNLSNEEYAACPQCNHVVCKGRCWFPQENACGNCCSNRH